MEVSVASGAPVQHPEAADAESGADLDERAWRWWPRRARRAGRPGREIPGRRRARASARARPAIDLALDDEVFCEFPAQFFLCHVYSLCFLA